MNNSDIFSHERDEIRKRREAANVALGTVGQTGGSQGSRATDSSTDFVGVSLSGGGMRSAAFNLGLLQSLHVKGLLRFVDYLSSVSGGSYAAGAYADSVTKAHAFQKDRFALGIDDRGQASPLVAALSRGGNYLFRLDLLANRYIAGLLLNLIPRVSLIIAIGAGIAFLWRCLDYEWVREQLSGLLLDSDLTAAFLPGILISLLWLLSVIFAMTLKSRPLKAWSHRLFWLSIVCFLISVMVVLGNGDVSIGANAAVSDNPIWRGWQPPSTLRTLLVVLMSVGLIPALFPKMLFRSGVSPRSWIDTWIFYYTSFALFLGFPLLVVGFFARENISGFATYRRGTFVAGDIRRIDPLLVDLAGRAENSPTFEWRGKKYRLHDEARRALWPEAQRLKAAMNTADVHAEPLKVGRFGKQYTPEDHSLSRWVSWRYLSWPHRLVSFAEYRFDSDGNSDYAEFLKANRQRWKAKGTFAKKLNTVTAGSLMFTGPVTASNSSRNVKIDPGSNLGTLIESTNLPDTDAWMLQSDTRKQQQVNRLLLEAMYPHAFFHSNDVRRTIGHSEDQAHRFLWFLAAAAVFLGSAWLTNPNLTSLHDLYRDRLAVAFLNVEGDQHDEAFPEVDHEEFANCRPHEFGAPYPLLHAAVARDFQLWKHASQLEAEFRPFLLSPRFCGSESAGFVRTEDLPRSTLTVADTMAISGAALSPNYFVHHIVVAVMTLLNLRTGKWLPNPAKKPITRSRPNGLTQILSECWPWRRTPSHVLVTDGGHHENLGLEALLDRRCRVILVSDAGRDPSYNFDDLARLMRRYELSSGVRLLEAGSSKDFDPCGKLPRRHGSDSQEARGDAGQKQGEGNASASEHHFFLAEIEYPDADNGLLVYVKPCLTGDEPLTVKNFAFRNPEFPHDTTFDQAFSQAQFEAYRILGVHSGNDLYRELSNITDLADQLWSTSAGIDEVFGHWLPAAKDARHAEPVQVAAAPDSNPFQRIKVQIEELCAKLAALDGLTSHQQKDFKQQLRELRRTIATAASSNDLSSEEAESLKEGVRELVEELSLLPTTRKPAAKPPQKT